MHQAAVVAVCCSQHLQLLHSIEPLCKHRIVFVGQQTDCLCLLQEATSIHPHRTICIPATTSDNSCCDGCIAQTPCATMPACTLLMCPAEAHNNLGVLQRDVGAIPDALSSYERALQLVPESRNAGAYVWWVVWLWLFDGSVVWLWTGVCF